MKTLIPYSASLVRSLAPVGEAGLRRGSKGPGLTQVELERVYFYGSSAMSLSEAAERLSQRVDGVGELHVSFLFVSKVSPFGRHDVQVSTRRSDISVSIVSLERQ